MEEKKVTETTPSPKIETRITQNSEESILTEFAPNVAAFRFNLRPPHRHLTASLADHHRRI